MYKYLKILFIITLAPLLCCCGDDDDDSPSTPEKDSNTAEYYVKYEGTISSIYSGDLKYIVYTDEGEKTFYHGKNFSQTFGPFKKGYYASITADASSWFSGNCEVSIYVCRGSEPFALKAHATGGLKVTTSYVIDY